jgi:hypothetical protein
MTAPDVMKNAETEPEASHLRNVLRQVIVLVDTGRSRTPTEVPFPLADALTRIEQACRAALARPRTNGHVIDELMRVNGNLQSEIVELQLRIDEFRQASIAAPVATATREEQDG